VEKCNTKLVRCFTTNSFKSPFKNKLSVNKWNITFFNSQKTNIKGNLTYIYPLASTLVSLYDEIRHLLVP